MLHFFYKVHLSDEDPLQGAVLTCLPDEDDENYADAIVFEPEMRVHPDGESCTLILPETVDGYPLVALEDFLPEEDGEADALPITGICLPKTLERIHPGAFEWLDQLERFHVAAENPVFEADSGILYHRADRSLIRCPMGWRGDTLTVRPGTLRIAENGLSRCREPVCILLPDGLETLDTYAVCGCGRLEYIRLPESLRTVGMGCFLRCGSLPYLHLPPQVETVGEYAFADCGSLLGVQLPEGLRRLGTDAFKHCEQLGGIALPRSLTAVPSRCFDGCTRLSRVRWQQGGDPCQLQIVDYEAFKGCTTLTELELPEGLCTIGQYAFSGCTALRSIRLPASLREMFPSGRAANGMPFGGCAALEQIIVREGNPAFTVHDGALIGLEKSRILCFPPARRQQSYTVPDWVRSIGSEAFRDHPTLETVILPEELESISSGAFAGCTALTRIDLPDGLRRLGQGAFGGCTALTGIALPSGLRSVGRSTFEGCTALREVKLPVAAEKLDHAAFAGCTALEEIMLPEGLTELAGKVFEGCTRLQRVVLPRSLAQVDMFMNTFENCPELTLYVPRGSYAEEVFSRFGRNLKKVFY